MRKNANFSLLRNNSFNFKAKNGIFGPWWLLILLKMCVFVNFFDEHRCRYCFSTFTQMKQMRSHLYANIRPWSKYLCVTLKCVTQETKIYIFSPRARVLNIY